MTQEERFPQGLVLVGMRGTGKSSVGRVLSRQLGRSLIDTDEEIERASGQPIRDLFARFGEPGFRDLETEVLQLSIKTPGQILATGGGIVLCQANRRALRDYGFVVWLSTDPRVIVARLQADPEAASDRPALTPAGTLNEIAAVLAERSPLYRAVAHAIVDTADRRVEDVANAVVDAWRRQTPGTGDAS